MVWWWAYPLGATQQRNSLVKLDVRAAGCIWNLTQKTAPRPGSRFDVGFENSSYMPLHLWLALLDAKLACPNWHSQNWSWLVAAALLKAVGESKLVNVKARIEWFHWNDDVHEFESWRKLAG
jgi:hypothetical protein